MKRIPAQRQAHQNSVTVVTSANLRKPCDECGRDMTGKRKNAITCSVICSNRRSNRLKNKRRKIKQEESYKKNKAEFEEFLKQEINKAFIKRLYYTAERFYIFFDHINSFSLSWEYMRSEIHPVVLMNGWRRIAEEMAIEQHPKIKDMINLKKMYGK